MGWTQFTGQLSKVEVEKLQSLLSYNRETMGKEWGSWLGTAEWCEKFSQVHWGHKDRESKVILNTIGP